jgi:hypothetical protein
MVSQKAKQYFKWQVKIPKVGYKYTQINDAFPTLSNMRHATEHQQDFTELARHAFAARGYVPTDAWLQAAAKGLARLADELPESLESSQAESFDDVLKRCAGV